MSFVADFVENLVQGTIDQVVDIVTLDVEGIVDRAVGKVESIVHTITHPTEDPVATIMLAIAVYTGYNAMTAASVEAAVMAEAATAATAAEAAAIAQGMTTAQAVAAGQAAHTAVTAAAGMTAVTTGYIPPTGTGTATATTGHQALSGPMFDAQQLGTSIGTDIATSSTVLAEAGVIVTPGQAGGTMGTSSWAATREGALRGAPAVVDTTLAGPSLSVTPGTYGGVGAGSAAGSMVGWGGGPTTAITGISTGNIFLEDLKSVWTDSTDFTSEVEVDMSTDWAESESAWGDNFAEVIEETVEAGKTKAKNFYRDIEEGVKNFMDDPLETTKDFIEEQLTAEAERRHPFISGGKIPTTTQEFFDLGVDMALDDFKNWSPTIGYQAGGDPGSRTASAYPSFVRAETGILGDPFNLEGQDLALTTSRLASRLQDQQGLPLSQQQMGLPDPMGTDPRAFRQLDAPAEELQQLLNPSYAVNQYQQPMVSELVNQLNANAQVRGLAPSQEGVSRGIAPLLSKLRQDNLAALNRGAGLDLEARAQGMQQRAGDITSQLGYQDIGSAADTARKNITLNSLLALAQMSKPTIIGGSTSQSSASSAVPGTLFQGEVPVGNILSTGWDWLTGDGGAQISDNQNTNLSLSDLW